MKRSASIVVFLVAVTCVLVPQTFAQSEAHWREVQGEEMRQNARIRRTQEEERRRLQQKADEQMKAHQEAQVARQQEAYARYQTSLDALEASEAARAYGAEKGRIEGEADNQRKRVKWIKEAIEAWEAPEGYAYADASQVALVNPFAAATELIDSASIVRQIMDGTCLTMDEEYGVARVGPDCPDTACYRFLMVGQYPVLPDGSLLDDADKVSRFLEACASGGEELFAMTGEGQLVAVAMGE